MPLLARTLDFHCPIDFTDPQKASLSTEYPLKPDTHEDSSEFVARRYLETLWLPEALMPLPYLIHSFHRLSPSEIIKHIPPLLKTARSTQDKYHKELLQILQDEGGAGEIEETMMWYAWSHDRMGVEEGKEEEVDDESWRKEWLDRLEKRETQIQILLHMLLIGTPNAPPKLPQSESSLSSSPRKRGSPRKRRRYEIDDDPDPTLDDQLESLMDKLCVWQLVDSLDVIDPDIHRNDWAQEFCINIVEPLFKEQLETQCELLRSKIFPHESIPDSPDSDPPQPMKRSLSRALSRGPSLPPTRALSREPSLPPPAVGLIREKSTGDLFGASVSRTRSRSRSIAEDSRPNLQVSARTGVSSSKSTYEVTFRRSLSKPALDLERGKSAKANPVIARARSPHGDSKMRSRSGSTSGVSQEASQVVPRTLALETPPRGQSQLLQFPGAQGSRYLPQPESPPDPLDFFKSEEGSLDGEILAMETPVKTIKTKLRK